MKALILIHSCVKFALDGSNQASRDTWMRGLPSFPNLDCRFFIGDGTPTGEDESGMRTSLRDCPHAQLDNPRISLEDPNPYVPKADEIILHAPDDYIYMVWKFRAAMQWGCDQGADFIFKASGDTYVDLPRLMSSGFENYDYTGRKYGHFAVGGSGFWLSRKSAQCLLRAPVTDWADDRWVGDVLLKHDIHIQGDRRYGASPQQNPGLSDPSPLFPEPNNEQITAHLAEAPGHYHHSLMYKAHEIRNKPVEVVEPPVVVPDVIPTVALPEKRGLRLWTRPKTW